MKHFSRHIAAILTFAVVVTFLLSTACAPNQSVVSAATLESTPTETAKPTATLSPSPEPTPTPTATLEPTPEMTREEALKKLNITSEEIYTIGDLVFFECTLKDGSTREFLVCKYYSVLEPGVYTIKCVNVLDDTTFATYTTTDDGYKAQYNMMEHHEITLVPEFLQGATINYTDGIVSWPWYIDPLPKSKYMDMLADI